jgi:hypothetical protein
MKSTAFCIDIYMLFFHPRQLCYFTTILYVTSVLNVKLEAQAAVPDIPALSAEMAEMAESAQTSEPTPLAVENQLTAKTAERARTVLTA